MILELKRTWLTDKSTIGQLFVNGQFECFTLEDKVREVVGQPVASWKIAGQTAIPSGTYDIQITFSNRFQFSTPQLMNVPGFEGIRIHPGNTDADTEGCILVGQTKSTDFVGSSRAAYNALFPKIVTARDNEEEITITISIQEAVEGEIA